MKKLFTKLCLIAALAVTPVIASAAGNSGDTALRGEGKCFLGHIGLQMYSLRDSFSKDVDGTMNKVQDLGFKYVELAGTYGKTPEEFKKMLSDRGLVMIASHFDYNKYKDNPDEIGKLAQALGLKYAGVAWARQSDTFTVEQAEEVAKVFNNAGKVLDKYGVKFFYHNHGYEFQPWMNGKKIMDLLMEKTDPNYVSFEMDVMWTLFPGEDPVYWLKKYPNRWSLMHLKDLRKGVIGSHAAHTDLKNDVPLGTGQVDFPSVLKAAQEVGVTYYFIEDESPIPEVQIPQSLDYLENVRF